MRKFFRIASQVVSTNLLIKSMNGRVIAPFYHLVSEEPPPHVKNLYRILSNYEFEKDLEFLLKHFTPVDAKTLIANLDGKVTTEKPSLFLSFDDGFREVKEVVAPILLRKGIPATFFVNPAYINNDDLMYRCKISLMADRIEKGKYSKSTYAEIAFSLNCSTDTEAIKRNLFELHHNQIDLIASLARIINLDFGEYLKEVKPYLTLSDLQALSKKGFTIGGHGYNHKYFNEITFNEQLVEIEGCMKWIHTYLPDQPRLFAFPFTDFGVSEDLIHRMLMPDCGLCDLSFGTSGIQPVKFGRHLQRIPMEDRSAIGQKIICGEILYYLAKKGIGYYRSAND